MFWENFYALCVSVKKRPLQVVSELGIAKGAITAWKNGSDPSASNLKKLADYFGVTVDRLLGADGADADELAENTVKYRFDGKTVTKRFAREQMQIITKMIDAIPEYTDK